jgi:hypothetical protein
MLTKSLSHNGTAELLRIAGHGSSTDAFPQVHVTNMQHLDSEAEAIMMVAPDGGGPEGQDH